LKKFAIEMTVGFLLVPVCLGNEQRAT